MKFFKCLPIICISLLIVSDIGGLEAKTIENLNILTPPQHQNYSKDAQGGELHFYPSKKLANNEETNSVKVKVNSYLQKKLHAKQLKKIYKKFYSQCSKILNVTSDEKRCSPQDNFGLEADYFCFFLKLENLKDWKPHGFTKTSFMPNFDDKSIPVTCYLTAGYHFTPIKHYESPVKLWPESGFLRRLITEDKQCAPIITGIIDDHQVLNQYFDFRKLQCRAWDFATMKQDRITVHLNFRNWSLSLPKTTEPPTTTPISIPISNKLPNNRFSVTTQLPVSSSTIDKSVHKMELLALLYGGVNGTIVRPLSDNEEYLERRDPSASVDEEYAEFKLDVPGE